jgi:Fuc2NAc and GlcNAc transferase
MDGIDGLAAAQALVFAAGAQIVALGVPGWTGDLLWLLCGCSVGFLVFNWPPARLFMGDVGSGFLGFLSGALALLLWWQQTLPLATSLILFSVFWLDTSYTLIVRMFTSQAFTQPHRSHLYQKLAARRGHSWTTVFYLVYALFWLLPLAWASVRLTAPSAAVWWLLPALLPPLAAAGWLAAGLPDRVVDEPDD